MFVHDGSIDRELFEMSSEHIVLDKIPSLIENKYAYAITDEIEKEMFLLFSNQTIWESQKSEKEKHMTLFQLLSTLDDNRLSSTPLFLSSNVLESPYFRVN